MEDNSSEPQVITAKDPKKVEQGVKLGKMSLAYKREKVRKELMENDNEELRNHFYEQFKAKSFSYSQYILYSITGLSLFGFIYLWTSRGGKVNVKYVPKTAEVEKKEPENNKSYYETLG